MNIKTKQSLVLFSIILIEIVGFNNQWKYCFLGRLDLGLKELFISYLAWFKLTSIVFIVSLIIWLISKLRKQESEPLFIVYLIKGFQVKGSDLIGIFNVVFTLCSISWIGIEIYYQTVSGFLNALIYAGFMILYPLLIANYLLPPTNNDEKYHPKVLISAISLLKKEDLKKSIEEMDAKYPDKWLDQVFYNPDGTLKTANPFSKIPWGPWGVFDPVRKSIITHQAQFHEIVLIMSSEVSVVINEFPEELKPNFLVENFLQKHFPDKKVKVVIKSEEISGNDMKLNITSIENILNSLSKRKFENKDILFNITGGTAAFSCAMILNAIPYERQAEYARQDTGLIEEIPLDIYDVKGLWNELLEKVG